MIASLVLNPWLLFPLLTSKALSIRGVKAWQLVTMSVWLRRRLLLPLPLLRLHPTSPPKPASPRDVCPHQSQCFESFLTSIWIQVISGTLSRATIVAPLFVRSMASRRQNFITGTQPRGRIARICGERSMSALGSLVRIFSWARPLELSLNL